MDSLLGMYAVCSNHQSISHLAMDGFVLHASCCARVCSKIVDVTFCFGLYTKILTSRKLMNINTKKIY